MFLVFSNHFDVLMSKMIFKKKKKNIIGMHFGTKSYLKSNRNHTAKQTLDGHYKIIHLYNSFFF
jgi:hypothetical protein